MKYAKQENNTINIYNSLPATYNGIMNFRNSSEATKQTNGFYPLIEPTITEYQELVNLHFDEVNQVFTYDVRDFTQDEIDAFNQQKQFEKDAAFQTKKKEDGIAYADEINTKLIGIMRGKTQAQIDDLDIEFRSKILKYLDLIEGGDWWTAKRMIDNTTLPKIPEIKTLFLEVRQHIRNYVNKNYI